MGHRIRQAALWGLLALEGIALLLLVIAFWHLPNVRADWHGLLWLAVPVFALRGLLTGRFSGLPGLVALALLFIWVTQFNYTQAPMARATYLAPAARPLMGFWLLLFAAEYGRTLRHMHPLIMVSVGMGLVAGVLALTASQWTTKSDPMQLIVDALPVIDYGAIFGGRLRDMLLGFNVNEIAGALAWLLPLMAGVLSWRAGVWEPLEKGLRWLALFAFALMFLALFMGQSRFAIGGVIVALAVYSGLMLRGRARALLLAALGVLLAVQIGLFFNLFTPEPDAVSERDQSSVVARFELWASGLAMVRDHPLTGVGMSMYRAAAHAPPYLVPAYADNPNPPPHAHNAWVQIGADLGVFGWALLAILYGMAAWMLRRCWLHGPIERRPLVAGVGGGLLAHLLYSMGDTITLWDRYGFLFWWLLGLAVALYVMQQPPKSPAHQSRT